MFLGEELLTPTELYVKEVASVLADIKAAAHITGGGLLENIPRILPTDVRVCLDANNWAIPPVFGWLAAAGTFVSVSSSLEKSGISLEFNEDFKKSRMITEFL